MSACLSSVRFSVQTKISSIGGYNFEIVDGVVAGVLVVFAGWLVDVYFGRYKVMKVSIIFGSCGWGVLVALC